MRNCVLPSFIISFALTFLVAIQSATAGQTTCALPSGFSLLKNFGDDGKATSWGITYAGRLVYVLNQNELNDIYGGYVSGHGQNPPNDCSNIAQSSNVFAFRMGWKGDLLIAVGPTFDSGRLVGISILRYFPHDEQMGVSASGNQVILNYGRLHDLNARFCWSPNGDNLWWHNENHRAGAGPCVQSSWPWEYPISNVQRVYFH